MVLKIKRINERAQLPQHATAGSAGYDLHACLEQPVEIPAGEVRKILTGFAIALPDEGYAAFIYARSGLGTKFGVAPANLVGVIDSDYRGEVSVSLRNYSRTAYTVQPGDRIAQMIIAPVVHPELQEVDSLDETERGAGGFGSTGRG